MSLGLELAWIELTLFWLGPSLFHILFDGEPIRSYQLKVSSG